MKKCDICQGRTVKIEGGVRCLNSQCEGAKLLLPENTVVCGCGETMAYQGLTSWGEPTYHCIACGELSKL